MLDEAKLQIKSFKKGTPQQVIAVIAKSKTAVRDLEPVLTAIRVRRNKWLAHLDPETVRDPQALSINAKLTFEDLDRAFEETEKILGWLDGLFDGRVGPIHFVGGNDYRGLLKRVRWSVSEEQKQFGAKFETQFGHPPQSPLFSEIKNLRRRRRYATD